MADLKVTFREWVRTGEENYPAGVDFGLVSATINFADSSSGPVFKKGKWFIPSEVIDSETKAPPWRKRIVIGLKMFDLIIQLVTGTLIFGLMQALAERLRAFTSKKIDAATGLSWLGWNMASAAAGFFALLARIGLFITQILAAAIRFPLAIVSGFIGLIWGAVNRWTDKHAKNMFYSVADFIWPFAPKAGIIIAVTQEIVELSARSVDKKLSKQGPALMLNKVYLPTFIYMLSLVAAVTVVVLLATGTFGIGLAALPATHAIASTIATGLNVVIGGIGGLLGFGGTSFAATGGVGSLFSGIASWVFQTAPGHIAIKVISSTMFIGAVTAFFSQIGHSIKDNVEYTMNPTHRVGGKESPKDKDWNSTVSIPDDFKSSKSYSHTPTSSTANDPTTATTINVAKQTTPTGSATGSPNFKK